MESFIGTIMMFGFNFAPRGWAYCNGQLLPISQFTALFSLLGTTYGGDGRVTFGLPDFRGRTPVGMGQGPGLPDVQQGEMSGQASTTLMAANMPAHNHAATASVAVSSQNANTEEPAGNILATGASNVYAAAASATGALGGVTATTQMAGSNQPFNNMQPYLGINFCICLEGIFPSRN